MSPEDHHCLVSRVAFTARGPEPKHPVRPAATCTRTRAARYQRPPMLATGIPMPFYCTYKVRAQRRASAEQWAPTIGRRQLPALPIGDIHLPRNLNPVSGRGASQGAAVWCVAPANEEPRDGCIRPVVASISPSNDSATQRLVDLPTSRSAD